MRLQAFRKRGRRGIAPLKLSYALIYNWEKHPTAVEQPAHSCDASISDGDQVQPSGTILIIEPGNQERQYWMKRLKTSFPGCDVLEAEAGGEGIAAYQSQRIDCIVVELLLPDMSIFEVIGEFLSLVRYPGIAVIVLSPQPSLPMRPLVLSDGAQVLLTTSRMSGDELEKAIKNALAALH